MYTNQIKVMCIGLSYSMDNYPRLLFDDFHSELQIVRLIFEGGVSSIVDSMHDVMRRGRGGHNVTVMLLWKK